jgi:uncharacterized phage-associated protein
MEKETLEYSASHIANYFLWKAQQDKVKNMTPMKLIKLVYFAYTWNLAISNRRLFAERVEAWRHGPVIPSIYHEFKRFGNSPIDEYAVKLELETGSVSYPIIDNKDQNTLRVVEAVWERYKQKSGLELSDITHQKDGAWNKVYITGVNAEMKDEDMIERAKEAIIDTTPKN